MEPINYSALTADPFAQAAKGAEFGAGLLELQQNQQVKQLQLAQQQQVMQRQQQYQQMLQKLSSPDAKPQDWIAASLFAQGGGMSGGKAGATGAAGGATGKGLLDIFSAAQDSEKAALAKQSAPIASAFMLGNPTEGLRLLNQYEQAAINSGDQEDAKYIREQIKLLESDPSKADEIGNIWMTNLALSNQEVAEKLLSIRADRRDEQVQPDKVRQQLAVADKAVSDAKTALETAKNAPEEAAANAKLKTAQAKKAEIEANFEQRIQEAKLKKAQADAKAGGIEVHSAKITPDGTTVIVAKSGEVFVKGADGKEIEGDARVQAIRNSEQFGADMQGIRAGARKGAEIGQDTVQKAFKSVGDIRKNVGNLEAAIAALEAGATTGVIANKFPNWRTSTIQLKNIQNQLGLDVIGSVTFGALSEGELALAMETAMPTNMKEADLKKWLESKRDAQLKLADYLSDQARYLAVPGRSIGDWLQQVETRYSPESDLTVIVKGQTFRRPTTFSDQQWEDYKKAMRAR